MPNTLKIMFDFEIESTDKVRSVVNNVGRSLVKRKVLRLGSKETDVINNACIFDANKDLYQLKRTLREATSSHTTSQWVKSALRNQMVHH